MFRAKIRGESSAEAAWEAFGYGAVWPGSHGDRQTVHIHVRVFVQQIMGSSGEVEEGRVCKVLDLEVMTMTNWLLIASPFIVMGTAATPSASGAKHILNLNHS